MKRIAVLTGSRSEYDRLSSPIAAMRAHAGLEPLLIVTGSHLASTYGTVRQIEQDGFPVAERIESLLDSDTLGGRVRSLAVQLLGLTQCLERMRPDMLLVFGDREEALSGATAAAYMNIPCAHLCGGDSAASNVDDSVRHAVTKLAHLHFPASALSAERILRMGEEPWRIHTVGDPGLDRLLSVEPLDREGLQDVLGAKLGVGPLILVVQHPVSIQAGAAASQMETTLRAAARMGGTVVVGRPNSDAGNRAMTRVIDDWATSGRITAYTNLDRVGFVNLLRQADVLLGNSSMGVYEAPLLRLAAVNVGVRQLDREHSENMLFVPHDEEAIVGGLRTALTDSAFRQGLASCAQPFGDGNSGERIARILGELVIGPGMLVKRWT